MANTNELDELLMSLCENSASHIKCGIQIQHLVNMGADVNRKTIGGRTPLMVVCWKNRRDNVVEVLDILLSCGADVRKTDDFGWNALQFACRYNCTPQLSSIIDLFLRHGIDVNATTTNNWNCLHQLCKYNSGENLYQALHLLCRYCRRDFSAISKLLINAGARVDLVSSNNKTLLHVLCKYAVGLDLIGVMNNLIDTCQSTVDNFDYYQATAIVYAARLGCAKTVIFLMPYSRLNVIDVFGQNVVDHLKDVLSNSFPLCICCQRMDPSLPPELVDELNKKKPFYAKLNEIDRSALERAIPRRIDYGFTNTNQEAFIQLSSETAWNIIKDAWNTESDLDIAEILFFLREHTHQMDSKIDEFGCSRKHCHWCAVTTAVCKYVNQLVMTVANLDNRFQGEILQYGSSAENSKIIAPDEFDFMVVLANFKEEGKYDDRKYVVQYDGRDSLSIFENEQDGSISSAKLLYYFYMLLADAVNRINHLNIIFHNISFSETCVTLDCFYRGKDPLHPGKFVFKVSVDITVGVIRSEVNRIPLLLPSSFRPIGSSDKDDKQFLVPHRQVSGNEISGWKSSFPTVECNAFHAFDPVVIRCYCLLKLLVLLAAHIDEKFPRKTMPSSYAIKTCLFNYVKKNPPPWDERHIVKYCIGICDEFINEREKVYSFFEKSVTVYVIKYESQQAMRKIRDRLKSAKKSCCVSSMMCLCKELNVLKCKLS